MNRTLFGCGFKRKIDFNGKEFDVTSALPQATKIEKKLELCHHCGQSFSGKQYLNMHLHFKHRETTKSKQNSSSNFEEAFTGDTNVQEHIDLSAEGATEQIEANGKSKATSFMPRPGLLVNESGQYGSSQRKSYTLEFKMRSLHLLDSMSRDKVTDKWNKVAASRGVSKSMIVKWHKKRKEIENELALNKRKNNKGNIKELRQRRKLAPTSGGRKEKYPEAARAVVAEFKLRRAQGSRISKLWLCKKMKMQVECCYGKEAAQNVKASSNWFQRFKKRYNITLRKRTNKKRDSAEEGREKIQKFHRELRKALKSTRRRSNLQADATYGRWLPEQRYNVDQVPLPFVIGQEKTYESSGSKQVWVSQPSSGLDKRQATLQLCIKASGSQIVKPAIVFRGKGNITPDEKLQYDKDVDVYFQPSAWMDEELTLQWVKGTLIPPLKSDDKEKVLFADNVGFQLSKEFHDICRKEINTVVYMLPASHTDKLQPIDAGCGMMIKKKIGEAMERWLTVEAHLELWHNKTTARMRRVLMTKWTGEAWREIREDKEFFTKLFEKTGCLITVDGSGDSKIQPQGLIDYAF